MINLREVHPYSPCLLAPLPCFLRLSYENFQCNNQKTGFQIQTRIPLDFGLHILTKEKEYRDKRVLKNLSSVLCLFTV